MGFQANFTNRDREIRYFWNIGGTTAMNCAEVILVAVSELGTESFT